MDNTIKFNMSDSVARIAAMDCNFCCVTTEFPADTVPTMAYIPFQLDKTTYPAEQGFCEGTIFPVLNKPFCGRGVMHD